MNGLNIDEIKSILRRDEGLSLKVYKCDGIKHIGYGINIEANPLCGFIAYYLAQHGEITDEMAEYLLDYHLSNSVNKTKRAIPQHLWDWLTPRRRGVFVMMSYNMGIGRFLAFNDMRLALKNQDIEGILREMKDSEWFRSPLTHKRAVRLIEMFKEG